MPNIQIQNEDKKMVTVYVPPLRVGCYNWCETGESNLRAYRADAARSVGEFAKIKEIKKYFMRIEKSCTMVLNWFNAPIGCNEIKGWPTELSDELDIAFNRYELATRLPHSATSGLSGEMVAESA